MSLQSFIEKLESLPYEVQRNLQLMRELDVSSQSILTGIENDTKLLLERIDDMDEKQRYKRLKAMTESFNIALKQGEDKVSLAAQTYTLTEQAINKLDDELERFEQEELINIKPIKAPDEKGVSKNMKKGTIKSKKEKEEPSRKKKRTQVKDENSKPKAREKNLENSASFGNQEIEEPTYCYCNQISFGDMVGCDNETCVREWFHYQCVGLKTQPKGKWYCNDCIALRKVAGRK